MAEEYCIGLRLFDITWKFALSANSRTGRGWCDVLFLVGCSMGKGHLFCLKKT